MVPFTSKSTSDNDCFLVFLPPRIVKISHDMIRACVLTIDYCTSLSFYTFIRYYDQLKVRMHRTRCFLLNHSLLIRSLSSIFAAGKVHSTCTTKHVSGFKSLIAQMSVKISANILHSPKGFISSVSFLKGESVYNQCTISKMIQRLTRYSLQIFIYIKLSCQN